MRNRFHELTPLPPIWSQLGVVHQKDNNSDNTADTFHKQSVVHAKEGGGHEQLWDETRALIERIEGMMEEDSNSVRGRELSIFLGEALTILSTSSYDDCCRVMNLLQAYNLDLPHYNHAIHAAALEQNWTEAAGLFRQKIDPDMAGFTPVDMPVAHPLGLYAIAKHA